MVKKRDEHTWTLDSIYMEGYKAFGSLKLVYSVDGETSDTKNYAEVVYDKFYKAMMFGKDEAPYHLAYFYNEGLGVEKNSDAGALFTTISAELGNESAQIALKSGQTLFPVIYDNVKPEAKRWVEIIHKNTAKYPDKDQELTTLMLLEALKNTHGFLTKECLNHSEYLYPKISHGITFDEIIVAGGNLDYHNDTGCCILL